MMVKLQKFYDLLSRNARLVLESEDHNTRYYEGRVCTTPDEYDGWIVTDFQMDSDGDLTFQIRKEA